MEQEKQKESGLEINADGLTHELKKDEILDRFNDTYEEVKFPDTELPDSIEHTEPRFIKTMISERLSEMKQDLQHSSVSEPKEIERFLERQAFEIRDSLFKSDPISGLPTDNYYKLHLMQLLEDEMHDSMSSQFDNIACINISLNGLRLVNDMGGRTSGDKYLKLVANWLRNSDTLSDLKQSGATLSIARLRGDEFAVAIADKPADDTNWQKKWTNIQISLQQELERLDVADILPDSKIKETIPEISDNFKFKATASIGISTLDEALRSPANKEKNVINKSHIAKDVVQKTMGSMLDLSYEYMQKNKSYAKKMLEIGNPDEQTLARLYNT